MPGDQPFIPIATSVGKTVVVAAVSTSSVSGTLTATGAGSWFAGSVLVTNGAAVTLFARMGVGAQVATTLDIPMPPNSQRVFASPNPQGAVGVAAIGTGLGNGNVYFTPGNGGI